MITRDESWNEDNPFISKNHVPRFVPPKEDDPKKGSVEEPRRGPFPIGARGGDPTSPRLWWIRQRRRQAGLGVRVAVIGSGSMFVGPTLPPIKEKMLLDVVNWLLGRDDLLAKDVDTWEYPRVQMSETAFNCCGRGLARLGFCRCSSSTWGRWCG